MCQVLRPGAALGEVAAHYDVARSGGQRHLADGGHFRVRVARVVVDGHHDRNVEDAHVLDLGGQVLRTLSHRVHVLFGEGRVQRLAGDDSTDTTVHLESADRRHHDRGVGPEPALAALDVEELLRAHVRTEAGLGAGDLARGEREPVGQDRVVSVSNVRERAAVDEGRPAFERLQQVRFDGVDEQHSHRAGALQVFGRDPPPVERGGDDHPAEAPPQILQVGCEREDRHDFRSDRDLPLGLARVAVLAAAEADDRLSDGAVGDVHDTRPEDAEWIDAKRVAVGQRVVDEGRQQVMGRSDGVVVAGEVEVEVLHRDHLAVTAARGSALDTENRSQRWLANADRGTVADPVEPLHEADVRGRLAFAERGRRDRGNDYVLAALAGRGRLCLEACYPRKLDLGLVRPVQLDFVVVKP